MPSQTDVREIDTEGNVAPKRKFDAADFNYIAEYVCDEAETRKRNRSTLEKQWKEIDRQVAMEPDITHKMIEAGKLDPNKAWMSEMELPYQATALEVHTADIDRMEFPSNAAWFNAHAECTDDYLRNVDFQSIILGDETEVPSKINQDNADKLVEGFLLDTFRQTDLRSRYGRINAEVIKYGMGVGRARMETKNVYIHEARGVRKETQKVPVLVPVSIKNLLLDGQQSTMHSAQVLGDAHIASDHIKLANLIIAANKGSTDPENEDGGWMPKNLKGIVADKDGYVDLYEMEGDIVVPRKTTRSVVIPGAIVTVVKGSKGNGDKATSSVIRFRFRKYPFSSYVLHPYHHEGVEESYATSPLMKGRIVQLIAVQAINRLLDSAALKNSPPVGWDRSDTYFASKGGPVIHPSASWGTNEMQALQVFDKVGGDPAALMSIFVQCVNMYAELTGVLPARLGAQTVSHTTAYSKDVELTRGAARTVAFVQRSGDGPMTRWLDMAYQMGRDALGSKSVSFFIEAYGGYVEVQKKHLPEKSSFSWFGAGGPAEEAAKKQMKVQSANMALQIDNLDVQMGGKSDIDRRALKQSVLREGGWTDLDSIMRADTATMDVPANPGAVMAAIQQVTAPEAP